MTAGGGFPGVRELGFFISCRKVQKQGFGRGSRERPRMRALSSAKDTALLTWERWAQPLDQVHGEEEMVFTDQQSLKNSLLKGGERGKGRKTPQTVSSSKSPGELVKNTDSRTHSRSIKYYS